MLFAIAVILILIADQGLKYWVTLSIPLDDGVRALFPGFLELRNIHNTGAAFSLLAGAPRWIFIILAVIFIVIIVLAVRKEWVHGAFGRWMAILLLAGALGNCLDRMLSGYVVDMLAFEFWPSFPVFNIADVCIVVGAIGFFLHVLLYKDPEAVAKEAEQRGEKRKQAGRTEVFKPRAEKRAGQPVAPDQAKPAGSVTVLDGGLEIYVVVGGLVDLAGEVARLQKDLAKAEKDLAGVERTLANEGFVAKAAPEVIEKKRAQQAELEQRLEQLRAQAADLA